MHYKSEFWLEGAKHWEKWSHGDGSSLRQVGHRAAKGCFGAAAPARWVGGGHGISRFPPAFFTIFRLPQHTVCCVRLVAHHPAHVSVFAVTGSIEIAMSGLWSAVSFPQSQPLLQSYLTAEQTCSAPVQKQLQRLRLKA